MSAGLEITTANFATEVEQSSVPVLVDFWAEWCMPCRMIAPHLDDLARSYAGKVKVGKINVDAQPDLSDRFSINSIPTLIVFKDGKPHKQKIGALSKHEIEAMFKDLI
ncbi:MAG: thioredoxin [Spirochaetia bacterium]|nr:thioredoxin [Spirochaetia bacterium]